MDSQQYSMAERWLNLFELCLGLMFFSAGAFYAYLFCMTGKTDFILLFVTFIGFVAGIAMIGRAIVCMSAWHSHHNQRSRNRMFTLKRIGHDDVKLSDVKTLEDTVKKLVSSYASIRITKKSGLNNVIFVTVENGVVKDTYTGELIDFEELGS
ncbi:hypothetical protein AT00_20285 [Pseudoalteromonas lipolytica SCSIO 04301]|uniref:hypothetical protein n=1 Tax=Pseudoalteromonas TaxID=53246 RepID=UPI00044588CC|nr:MULTISPECIES: hypothetical protein [Pseudoalteromonas]EWH04501.1 hypothetical protein AT00_20285 [Pseudoalteromonas lipolytica SCSIO 04301]KZY40465.1 hypothetical protein A3733_23740 [Pseudoalteromonas shioyasakiensis]TMO44105.1 hypothetical protein CWC25_10100 [Pseudoalteromonas sp. S4389]HCV03631.1 hypothetical protein [Pseudoalteromonas sp.]|tara:strand:- start:306 stop:764 length:459 start_codon:yes stop_codon:yes gene_type:complete